ncbi:AAEL014884-PA, partial [Aedes aegypti]
LGRTSSIDGLGVGRVDRGTLIDRYRIWARSGVACLNRRLTRGTGRLLLAEQAAEVLGIDKSVGVEQSTGTSRSGSNSQPLIDVGSNLLLNGIGNGVLDSAEYTTEESSGRSCRFLRWDHNVTTGAVELSWTTVSTTTTATTTTTVVIVAT